MHTLDFNRPMTELSGKEGEQGEKIMLSKTLADIIGTMTEGKTIKLYDWYRTLLVGNPLVLDDSDLEDLKALITNHKTLYIYVKGQLLDVINKK